MATKCVLYFIIKPAKKVMEEVRTLRNYLVAFVLVVIFLSAGCGKTNVQMSSSTNDASSANTERVTTNLQKSDSIITTPMVNHSNLTNAVINHVPFGGKKVALTFDDGPDEKYTPRILDILKKNQIKATFFVIGEHAQQYPQMIKRIEQEGHAIGNHSWDHPDLTKLSNDKIQSEIVKTDELVKSITGQAPILFRAPYGALSRDVVADATETGHRIIGWSVDTLDWDGRSVAQILRTVRKEVRPGAIILQHSAGGKGGNLNNTVEALPQIITYLKQKGYSFVTVPELLQSGD
jgi:polysaccharide deacetylase family sporulation protein PdaB